MKFGSDNEAPVRPEIMAAIEAANTDAVPSYGEDSITESLKPAYSQLFETELNIEPIATGTAANAIALSQIIPRYGAIVCHARAHILLHECGAPEFFSGGKLIPVSGEDGKMKPELLQRALHHATETRYHSNHIAAVSLTQATEYGTVYTGQEIRQIADITHESGAMLHMDGARFANALVFSGCTPAEMTWKAGVDILTLGSSKNGTLNAEAIITFNPDLNLGLKHRLKQSGHLASKSRYLSAQLLAYVEKNRWLDWAQEANQMARMMYDGLKSCPDIQVALPVEANFLVVRISQARAEQLLSAGVRFYPWHERAGHYRLVLSNQNTAEDVDAFLAVLKTLSANQ